MDFSTSFEVWLACCSLLFGMAGMLLYDCFCIWRLAVPAGRGALFVQDLLYWTLLAISCILFLFVVNRGQPRLFILLFALAGAGLYRVTLGRLVMSVASVVARALRRALLWVLRVLAAPIRLWRRARRPARRLKSLRYRKRPKKR